MCCHWILPLIVKFLSSKYNIFINQICLHRKAGMRAMISETNFSLLLKEYIEKNHLSKNELVRESGIDRSSFFQFLNGKRIPTKKQINDIILILQISSIEKKNLIEQYERMQIGDHIWKSRSTVRRCLETVANSEKTSLYRSLHVQLDGEPLQTTAIYVGKENVSGFLQTILMEEFSQEHPKFDFFMPLSNVSFYESLKRLSSKSRKKEIHIRQLAQFPAGNEDIHNEIIDFFETILFLRLCNEEYHTFYFYDVTSQTNCIETPFSYYLVAKKRVVLVNNDFSKAIVIYDALLVQQYCENFERALINTKEVIVTEKQKSSFSDIQSAPLRNSGQCFYYSGIPYTVYSVSSGNMYRLFCEKLQDTDFTGRSIPDEGFMEFMGLKKLNEFMKSGDSLFPEKGKIQRITMKDRQLILNELKKKLNDNFFLLNETKLPDWNRWELYVIEKGSITFYDKGFSSQQFLRVTEPNIVNAFVDFFKSLNSSEFVISKDTANKFLKQL